MEEERAFTPPVPKSPREEDEGEEQLDVHELEEEMISPEQDREALVEMYHVGLHFAIAMLIYHYQCALHLQHYYFKTMSN